MLGVDHKTVAPIRGELESTGEIPQLDRTVGKDGKARPAKAAVFASAAGEGGRLRQR
jgi:hypothetical protein